MINIIAIIITISSIIYLLLKNKSFLDFRVFMLIYILFFYQLSFYSYYYLEHKVEFSQVENIGPINFLVILAYLFASFIFLLKPLQKYKRITFYSYNKQRESFIQYSITIFLVILLIIYYLKANTFPIFLDSVEDGRIELAEKVSGFIIVLLQFIFVLFVLLMSKAFYKRQSFKIIIILLLFILFWLVMAAKRPIAGLLLMTLIFYIYQKRKIPNWQIAISILFILTITAVYGSIRLFNDIEIEHILRITMSIFNAEMFNMLLILNDPPPLQYGETYLNSILMIFTDVKDIGTILKNYYDLTFKGGGITIGIIGEGFINFSYVGVFLESFIFWLIVINLSKRIEQKSYVKDYFSIGKYIFYFYFLLWVLRNGFFAAITPLLYVVIFEFITLFIRKEVHVK